MKKNWKKVLSLILAISMVLTMNTSVFATSLEGTDPAAAAAPAAETPAAEEPAQTPEAAPEATEPAPEAAAPAAEETEAPAVAEEPSKAEEAAEAVKEEAPAPAPAPAAEAEQEDAAEGNEYPNLVPQGVVLSTNLIVQFEKHGAVVSDNSGNLTVKKNTIASIKGTANKEVTVTLEENAKVYVGRNLDFAYESTDRERLFEINDGAPLKNVTFTGEGTVYYYDRAHTSISINNGEKITLDLSEPDVSGDPKNDDEFVLSANNGYKFFIDKDDKEYKERSFTGLSGKISVYNFDGKAINNDGLVGYFAKEVSANKVTVSVNKDVYAYKGGKFELLSENSTINIGKDEGYDFGKTIVWNYQNKTDQFYYTTISAKPAQPDVSGVKLTDGKVLEGAWRKDGVDLDQVVKNILKYQKMGVDDLATYDGSAGKIKDIEFVLVKDGDAAPAQDAKGWAQKPADAHAVFNSLADGSKISANDVGKTYKIYARNASYVTSKDPKENTGFYSDPVEIGSFITKEIPATIEITIPSEIVYQGDAADSTGTPFYGSNYSAKFTEKGMTYDELKVGEDGTWGGYSARYYDNETYGYKNDGFIGRAVKIDGQTVGVLKNYVILGTSENKIDSASVNKMSVEDIVKYSKATLGGMYNLAGLAAEGQIKYLSANKAGSKYYVKAIFEAYDPDSYTNTYKSNEKFRDIPYLDGASSNAVELTVKKANLTVVPQVASSTKLSDKYGAWKGWGSTTFHAYTSDPELVATSGNAINMDIYAFDPDKDNIDVAHNMNRNYLDNKDSQYIANKRNIIDNAVIDFNKKAIKVDGTADPYYATKAALTVSDSGIFMISENSLKWHADKVSDNFIVTYPEFKITVNEPGKQPEQEILSYNHLSLKGRSWYGSDYETITNRIYETYTISGNKGTSSGGTKERPTGSSGKIGVDPIWNWSWGEEGYELGSGLYKEKECKTRISDNMISDLEPGVYYLSVNSFMAVSPNATDKSQTKKMTGLVAEITIEPRPIDVYAHAYPLRNDPNFKGEMDSSEVYGDVKSGFGEDIVKYDSDYDNVEDSWKRYNKDLNYEMTKDSTGRYYGYDQYDETKKANFQGDALLADTKVTAKDWQSIDLSEPTVKEVDGGNKYINDAPKKLYLDKLETGFKASGSTELAANLKNANGGNFYINTAVGYVTILPVYTVTYMLQYEDPKNISGKANPDKLYAYQTISANKNMAKRLEKAEIEITPNAHVTKDWYTVENGTAWLNKDQGDAVIGWRYMREGGNEFKKLGAGLVSSYLDSGTIPINGDYFVNAVVGAYAGSNVYVQSIDPVMYTGLAHVDENILTDEYDRAKLKNNQVADLGVVVRTGDFAGPLVYGKDYTISYKNNINASVYYEDDTKTGYGAKVKQKFADKKKKPQVIIKGAGKYKGKFSATINFDIYPAPIWDKVIQVYDPGDDKYIPVNRNIDPTALYYNDPTAEKKYLPDYEFTKDGDIYPTLNGVKKSYFATATKSAKLNFKVQNVQYPSEVTLYEEPGETPEYRTSPNHSKAKVVTLKAKKDYVQIIEKKEDGLDKNGQEMGWISVAPTSIFAKEGGEVTYKVKVKGVGNYCGYTDEKEFKVYDQGSYEDISKLKVTVPSSLKWENLMLNKDNSIKGAIEFKDLGIKVESKKKIKDPEKESSTVSTNFRYEIFKINKNGRIEGRVANNRGLGNNYPGGFNDAGLYKVVIYGGGSDTFVTNKSKGTTKTTYYAGTLEKNFTIKGIDLKASDFQITDKDGKKATKLKWDGKDTNVSLAFSKGTKSKVDKTPVFGKNQINRTYVDTYLKGNNIEKYSFEPVHDGKKYVAYIRDWYLGANYYYDEDVDDYRTCTDTSTTRAAAEDLAEAINVYRHGSFTGDVYYYDTGSNWAVEDQLDVYRFVFNPTANNKEIGTYYMRVPTDGIFGTDGVELKYQRTGTATKVLEVKKAK